MSEDDIKSVVQALKGAMAEEFEQIYIECDRVHGRISNMERRILNELASLGRRVRRLEER